ncbi:hypothetical protein NQ318_020322 [Aromia moschata]|uniref:Uncharacterized protein n=1 Tax=Aromia moschata TaxID=1265417 RepID=A0AAV8XDJ5_9CUCU|nr:hypothetical protein NQ318_020322 [Aromia moschata]
MYENIAEQQQTDDSSTREPDVSNAESDYEEKLFCTELQIVHYANKISTSVYECDWLAADTKFKKSMILTLARLQKPIYLTAGNFAPLTLATFVGVKQ